MDKNSCEFRWVLSVQRYSDFQMCQDSYLLQNSLKKYIVTLQENNIILNIPVTNNIALKYRKKIYRHTGRKIHHFWKSLTHISQLFIGQENKSNKVVAELNNTSAKLNLLVIYRMPHLVGF